MRSLLIILMLFAFGSGQAAVSGVPEEAVGLWQFPDRGVWIQVNSDGSTFQCRHAPSGTLFSSKGIFVSPVIIEWQDIWDTDKVSVENGSLTLTGKWGSFSYRKAKDPLYEQCLASVSRR